MCVSMSLRLREGALPLKIAGERITYRCNLIYRAVSSRVATVIPPPSVGRGRAW